MAHATRTLLSSTTTAMVALLFWVAPGISQESEDGFQPIFNGESLDGWSGQEDLWSVQDGAIVGETTAERRISANTFLIYQGQTFADFELRLSYRIHSGNSGIQYRSRVLDEDRWVVGGYQADVCFPEGSSAWIPGICYEEKGRGILARRGQTTRIHADGQRHSERREGEDVGLNALRVDGWNDYVIRAEGPRLEQWINGVLTALIIDEEVGKRASEGVIALQLHTGPAMKVEFRDLRVREIESRPMLIESPIIGANVVETTSWDPGPAARWIWGPDDNTPIDIRRTFNFDGKDARLIATCDNVMTVRINGTEVAKSSTWENPVRVKVQKHLKSGENTIEVVAENQGGPAGFAAKLSWADANGGERMLATDEHWQVSTRGQDSWEAPRVLGDMGVGPWGDRFGTAGGGLHVDTIKHLPGFQVEMLYKIPKASEGSWVSITHDLARPTEPSFIVSDQYGGMFRVTAGPSHTDTVVEKLDTPIGKAHGLLYAFDSLYVMGAGPEGTGFYRLFDHDGDGQYEEHRFLAKFKVGGEHDAHAIHLSPDGKSLYIVAGNMTPLPENTDSLSPRHRWANDFLIPSELPPSGHNAGGKPLGGYVVQTDPNGESFKMICGGFRNPYDMAFDRNGELFVYDSDMEYDGGAPWYKPTRLLHIHSGADYGWRRGAGKWPAYYADSLDAVIDIGQGSPTGVTFGYGAKFPARYQEAIYLLDWTYGRIRAVHLEPNGPTFTATAEDFIVGRPLPLTDATIGPDGAMYFLVGGRRTESRMFRVRYVGSESTEPIAQTENPKGQRARELRRSLEALHREIGAEAVEKAWPYLGSSDRSLRHVARVAIEHQPLDLWRNRALNESSPAARVTAMVAFARVGSPSDLVDAVRALGEVDLRTASQTTRLEALRAWSLSFIRLGRPDEPSCEALCRHFESLFPTGQKYVDREIARLLVYFKSTQVIAGALDKMRSSPIQEEQMYYANLLRLVEEGWTVEQKREYFRWINRGRFHLKGSADFDAGGYFHYQGGRSFRPYVEVIGKRAREHLTDADRADAELAALLAAEAPPAPTADESLLELQAQPVVWQVQDLLGALERLRSGRSFERGRAAFHAVRCAECHSHGAFTADQVMGPDLTLSAGRFSGRDLLEAIIEPSKVVSDQYADRTVWTKSGLVHTGIILEDEPSHVLIRPDPTSDETVRIERDDVDEVELSRTSRMPRDLLNFLSEDQILDLLAYILSGGDKSDDAFRD